jgi:hypothetical protein
VVDNTGHFISEAEADGLIAEHNAASIERTPGTPLRVDKLPNTFSVHYAANFIGSEVLANGNNHVCNLIGVAGPLRAPAYVRVSMDAWPDIRIVKDGNGPESWIECTARSNFIPRSGNPQPFQFATMAPVGPGIMSYAVWPGDTIAVVNGVGNSFQKTTDQVYASQAVWPRSTSRAGSHTDKGIGVVTPIAVQNQGDGGAIRFWGANGFGRADTAGEIVFEISGGRSAQHGLAPADSMCYFTTIQGNFATGADRAIITRVSPAGGNNLIIGASSNGYVKVKVRCLAFDQRF